MVRIAIVGSAVATQIAERPEALQGLEVAFAGTSVQPLLVPGSAPQVAAVILDLSQLGEEPAATVERLLVATGAQLAVVTYQFARRELLSRLADSRIRLLQSPTTLSSIRASMLSLIVSGIFRSETPRVVTSAPPKEPAMTAQGTAGRKFSPEQLARLLEIASTIQCECPNHLARLVSQLVAFEDYARDCENKSPADRKMHELLYRATVDARGKMEQALAELLVHERITV